MHKNAPCRQGTARDIPVYLLSTHSKVLDKTKSICPTHTHTTCVHTPTQRTHTQVRKQDLLCACVAYLDTIPDMILSMTSGVRAVGVCVCVCMRACVCVKYVMYSTCICTINNAITHHS